MNTPNPMMVDDGLDDILGGAPQAPPTAPVPPNKPAPATSSDPADDWDRILADVDSLAPVASDLVATATAALDGFLKDKLRVRIISVSGERLVVVVTSKPLSTASPTWYAGVAPAGLIHESTDLVRENDRPVMATRKTEMFEHTAWFVRLGKGQLVRVWATLKGGGRNIVTHFYGVAADGRVKTLGEMDYARLRKARAASG